MMVNMMFLFSYGNEYPKGLKRLKIKQITPSASSLQA